jgi:hypothetical protein
MKSVCVVVLVLFWVLLQAEVVVLRNGDRVTGTWQRVSDRKIVMNSAVLDTFICSSIRLLRSGAGKSRVWMVTVVAKVLPTQLQNKLVLSKGCKSILGGRNEISQVCFTNFSRFYAGVCRRSHELWNIPSA